MADAPAQPGLPHGSLPPRLVRPPDGLAVASLICGILSLLVACQPIFSMPLSISGVVCGLCSSTRVGMRSWGLACSVAGATLSVLLFIAVVLSLSAAGRMPPGRTP